MNRSELDPALLNQPIDAAARLRARQQEAELATLGSSYSALTLTSRDKELGFISIAQLLDFCENRLKLLARANLARNLPERDSDFIRGQAKEVGLLLEVVKNGK
jgi:hypothetical protein